MSSLRCMRILRNVAVLSATALLATTASAAVESSCPAPCAKPPKTALFLRETNGALSGAGFITTLSGTLLKGTVRTVLRLDASIALTVDATVHNVNIYPQLNGIPIGSGGFHAPTCDSTKSVSGVVTGTSWWDIEPLP